MALTLKQLKEIKSYLLAESKITMFSKDIKPIDTKDQVVSIKNINYMKKKKPMTKTLASKSVSWDSSIDKDLGIIYPEAQIILDK